MDSANQKLHLWASGLHWKRKYLSFKSFRHWNLSTFASQFGIWLKVFRVYLTWTNYLPSTYQDRRKRGAKVPPLFGQTINPISTKGADYTHHSTTCPPGFSDLATGLHILTKYTSIITWSCLTLFSRKCKSRAVVSGGALASPEFGSSVNPIPTSGHIMPIPLLLAPLDSKT